MGVNGIYGLSGSGMDIESLVKVGMMKKQNEYDKMAQKYTKNEWTKTAYLELNNTVTTFNLSTLSQYKLSSNMNAKTVESSSSSIKVAANASAPVMSHKVSVDKLSSNAYIISTNEIKRINTGSDTYSSTSLNLKDILFSKLEEEQRGTGTYDAEGHEIMEGTGKVTGTFKGGNGTSYSFGTSADGTYTTKKGTAANLDDKAISFFVGDGTKVTENGVEKAKTVEISYTFDEILNGNVTLNDVVSKINNAGLNIRATFDTVNETFSIYNTESGSENTIYLQAGANEFEYDASGTKYTTNFAGSIATTLLNGLGFKESENGSWKSETAWAFKSSNASNTATGEYGAITVDGKTYDKVTDNKITVNGITYTALEKTTSAATVSVTQDVDSIVDRVKSFVADYNKLLSGLYEKYDEKPESGYTPLTQSQKDAMKEEQITKWEEKAKKGLLYHDQTLGKIINEMRSAINTPVDSIDGKYNSAYSIGIGTTGIKGQLTLDEDKLRKALNEDPDSVYNLFAKLDEGEKVAVKNADGTYLLDDDGNKVYKTVERSSYNGIAQRLGDILNTAQKNIKSRAGSSADITEDSDLNTLLRNLQTKMSNFKKMMNSFEDALYKKYDKMESTLASLGTQLNFLLSDG